MGRQPTIFSWWTFPLQMGSRIESTFSVWNASGRAGKMLELGQGRQHPNRRYKEHLCGRAGTSVATRGGGEGGAESPALEVPPGPREQGWGALASPSTCGRDANTARRGEGAAGGRARRPSLSGSARVCVKGSRVMDALWRALCRQQ